MSSQAFVQLALQILGCSQKGLALRLGVSPTQITKWKNGEHMSYDMEAKFRELVKIGDRLPEFVVMAGSLEDAVKWEELIEYLAERAEDGNETGYQAAPLTDMPELLCSNVFDTLHSMGITLPKKFPEDLDRKFELDDENEFEAFQNVLESNIYSATIAKIFRAFTDVYGFYAAYVMQLVDDETLELDGTGAENIEPCLIDLAASKIEIDPTVAPNFHKFRYETQRNYKEWLSFVKDRAFRVGAPLKGELLDLVHETHDGLGHDAEAEALGLNDAHLHPDIYMNELLCGMRAIHQVLPAILKKMGLDKEFKLDTSEFYVDSHRRS